LALFAIATALFYRWASANNDFFKDRGIAYEKPVLYLGNMAGMFLRKRAMLDIVCDLYTKGGSGKLVKFIDPDLIS